MKLVYYPNPILLKPSEPVVEFGPKLVTIVEEMTKIMRMKRGLGLSAVQVGLLERLFIMSDNKNKIHTFINPRIVSLDGLVAMEEGCLSVPGIYIPIQRPAIVELKYQDIEGEYKHIIAEGLEARCILHELEHLDGVLYLQHGNRKIRKVVEKQFKAGKNSTGLAGNG